MARQEGLRPADFDIPAFGNAMSDLRHGVSHGTRGRGDRGSGDRLPPAFKPLPHRGRRIRPAEQNIVALHNGRELLPLKCHIATVSQGCGFVVPPSPRLALKSAAEGQHRCKSRSCLSVRGEGRRLTPAVRLVPRALGHRFPPRMYAAYCFGNKGMTHDGPNVCGGFFGNAHWQQ
jgi:hypothetical protein